MKILIADDSRAMRLIVTRTLRQAGFTEHEVVEATNGREGLDLAGQVTPDLILSDWNMPEMNGIEFLRSLRASGSAIAFGFVTSEGSEDMRATASDAGASFLITKPFTAEGFQEALTPYLS